MDARPRAVSHVDGISEVLQRPRLLEKIFGIAGDRRFHFGRQHEAARLQRSPEVGGRWANRRPHADAETRSLTANIVNARAAKIAAAAILPAIRHSTTAKTNMARSKATGTQDSIDARRRSSRYQSPGSVRARTLMIRRNTVITTSWSGHDPEQERYQKPADHES